MKSKKELYEAHLEGIVWREAQILIVVCSMCFSLIIVGIWKYEVYTTDLLSAIKWYMIAVGAGTCVGFTISSFLSFFGAEWLLELKRDRNHQRTQNCWTKKDALRRIVEENPEDKKAEIRLKRVEYKLQKLGVISQLLTNPHRRV